MATVVDDPLAIVEAAVVVVAEAAVVVVVVADVAEVVAVEAALAVLEDPVAAAEAVVEIGPAVVLPVTVVVETVLLEVDPHLKRSTHWHVFVRKSYLCPRPHVQVFSHGSDFRRGQAMQLTLVLLKM